MGGKIVFIIMGGKRVWRQKSNLLWAARVFIIMGGKRVFYYGREKSLLLWAAKECCIGEGGKKVFYCVWERCFFGSDGNRAGVNETLKQH